MEIRYITEEDDRNAVSHIYEESWKAAYRGMLPEEYLQSIPEGQWVKSLNTPGRNSVLCLDDGVLAGTSSFCKSRFEPFEGYGEIVSMYLLPEYIGKGYGKALMEFVLGELKKQGFKEAFLWVLEENQHARRFYVRAGFEETEEFLEDMIGGKAVREIGYKIKL